MAKNKAAAAADENKGGRPRFEPTDLQRGEVRALAAAGFTQSDISAYLGIAEMTLREHFRTELDFAGMRLIAGAVNNLGRFVLGAPAQFDERGNKLRDEVKPEAWAICFLLKTKGKRLGWSERVEVTGKDGGAIQHEVAEAALKDVRAMIAEELGTPGKPAVKH